RWSVSAISLFLAVDMDLRAAGLDSGNLWFYESPDIDGIYRLGMDPASLDLEALPGLFLTAPTLKDPTKIGRLHHTLEAFAFVAGTASAGLLLCGASTLAHGVFGAGLSGLVAASKVVRCAPQELLAEGAAGLPIYPSEDLAAWPGPLRKKIEALHAAPEAA